MLRSALIRYCCVVAFTVSSAFVFQTKAQTPTYRSLIQQQKTDAQVTLAFPLFLQDSEFTSVLVLVNPTDSPSSMDVMVRNVDSLVLVTRRVEVLPRSQQRIPVASLLDRANSLAKRGSIVLNSLPLQNTVVTGALSITQSTQQGPRYIDQEPAALSTGGSSGLRAVTDTVEGFPIISVTSLSSETQNISFSCVSSHGFVKSSTMVLPAGATRVRAQCNDNDDKDMTDISDEFTRKEFSRHSIPYGISLSSDQPTGSFAAFGLTDHHEDENRYFTSIPFTNPSTLKSPNTVFTGVPIGSVHTLSTGTYLPQLTVANFGHAPAHITALYYGTGQPVVIAKSTIQGGYTKDITLLEVAGDPNLEDSIIVTTDREPGEVVSKLISVGTGSLREVELPSKDESDELNAGQHPWTLEDDDNSTLLLFNHGESKTTFQVEIASDAVSWVKTYSLAAKQT